MSLPAGTGLQTEHERSTHIDSITCFFISAYHHYRKRDVGQSWPVKRLASRLKQGKSLWSACTCALCLTQLGRPVTVRVGHACESSRRERRELACDPVCATAQTQLKWAEE